MEPIQLQARLLLCKIRSFPKREEGGGERMKNNRKTQSQKKRQQKVQEPGSGSG